MNTHKQILSLFLILLGATRLEALVAPPSTHTTRSRSTVVLHGEGTGGWGIGNSRSILPEEFAKGDRRAFEGYKLSEQGDFMSQVKRDAAAMKDDEMDELLNVAKLAGIKMKDPNTRLNKFGADLMDDDDDDLDLSVPL